MYEERYLADIAGDAWHTKRTINLYLVCEGNHSDVCTLTYNGIADRWVVAYKQFSAVYRTVVEMLDHLAKTTYNTTAHKFRCVKCDTIKYIIAKRYNQQLDRLEAVSMIKKDYKWSVTLKNGSYCSECK